MSSPRLGIGSSTQSPRQGIGCSPCQGISSSHQLRSFVVPIMTGTCTPIPRPRASGSCQADIEQLLTGYFTNPKRIPKYGPRLDKDALGDCAGFLLQLKKVQSNLAFAPVMMTRALEAVAREKASAWQFSQEDCKAFAKDVERRIRSMCRHWMAAERKTKKPKWYANVLKHSGIQTQLADWALMLLSGRAIRVKRVLPLGPGFWVFSCCWFDFLLICYVCSFLYELRAPWLLILPGARGSTLGLPHPSRTLLIPSASLTSSQASTTHCTKAGGSWLADRRVRRSSAASSLLRRPTMTLTLASASSPMAMSSASPNGRWGNIGLAQECILQRARPSSGPMLLESGMYTSRRTGIVWPTARAPRTRRSHAK